jgi:hypothetical protein
MNASTIPLGQAFPWKSKESHPECILVTDSIETDGRFVLYAIVQDVVTSTSSISNPSSHRRRLLVSPNDNSSCNSQEESTSILWLSCHGLSEGQIRTSLKKIGCDDVHLTKTNLSSKAKDNRNEGTSTCSNHRNEANTICLNTDWTQSLVIHNVLLEWSLQPSRNPEMYLQSLYYKIRDWSKIRPFNLVILDDLSAMEKFIVQERYLYGFLSYVGHLPNMHLIMRCSNDWDQRTLTANLAASQTIQGTGITVNSKNWIGAGGRQSHTLLNYNSDRMGKVPMDRTLLEWADWIVDVVPLSSGPSREAHGRLVFTPRIHTITSNSQSSESVVFNYCLQDTSVQVIRFKR